MAKSKQAELAIQRREKMGKAVRQLRREGLIPANIFGHKEEPLAVQLAAVDFEALRRTHKTTGILALRLDDDGLQTALVRHVQRHPVTDKIQHIDFFRVSLTERIELRVSLHFIGDAPAVKNEGGVLLHLLDALVVECVAQDIVDSLEVDVSSLVKIDDTLYAKDIPLPALYRLITDPEEPLAKVAATRAEVEAQAAEEAAPAAEAAPAPAEGTSEASEK